MKENCFFPIFYRTLLLLLTPPFSDNGGVSDIQRRVWERLNLFIIIKSEEEFMKEILYNYNIPIIFIPVWFMVHQCGRTIMVSNHPDRYIIPLYLTGDSVQGRVRKGLYVTLPGWMIFKKLMC